MIVYHGSTEIIEKPNVSFSKDFLDFGKGFYVTTHKEQAEKWALRKCVRKGGIAVVNEYDLKSIDAYRVLSFKDEDEDWLDFVCSCRRGEENYRKYEIITGGVANDDVFKTVDMYFRGIWDKDRALEELRYYKVNDQICMVSQQVLDEALSYCGSYEVQTDD